MKAFRRYRSESVCCGPTRIRRLQLYTKVGHSTLLWYPLPEHPRTTRVSNCCAVKLTLRLVIMRQMEYVRRSRPIARLTVSVVDTPYA